MQTPGPLVAKCVHLAVAAPAVYPGTEAIVGYSTDSGRPLMNALRLILKPNADGWAVGLTDGRELARFRGPGSRWRALRYLASATNAL